MALSKKDLIALGKKVASANPSVATAFAYNGENFSYEQLNDTFRDELLEISSTYALFRENKNTIFSLMEEIIDDVLPKKVLEAYGQFAEIKTFKQGDKPVFVQRITSAAKRRGKQFVTKVGLAGIYEVFKLDGKTLEVPTEAFGGAAQIGFEEFLDGRVNMADVLDIIMEGLDESVYREIAKALKGAADNLQEANHVVHTGFDESEMDKLLAVADSYGQSTIYCTFEFAATMVPAEGWVSDAMRDQKWNNGYLANYKGHKVIVLPQSFEDETNKVKVIDPAYAYIIPTGAQKPVKVAFEGQTIVRDIDNADMSKEVQVYKKFGVATLITNNICVYNNTKLKINE
jgi:hypothetical protein|nr:MAG TPA: major capsid protein [Caudoviricetes sp.]